MRIAHVINYFQPKLGYQETFLAKEQIKMGHEVAMITSDRYYPFRHFKEAYGPILGNRKCGLGYRLEEGVPTYRLKTLFEIRYRVWLMGLEGLIEKINPDLVISHALLSSSFRLAKLKSSGRNFKLIVDDHMDIYARKDCIGKLYYGWKRKRIEKILIPWVDKFVGVTQASCNFLETVNGISKKKIEYISLGADSDLFLFNPAERKVGRDKYGIQDSDILLLYTGKINRSKGVDVLIKTVNSLNCERRVYLLMVGNGKSEFKCELMRMVENEKRDRVMFHSFVPTSELAKFYNAADICIWAGEISTSMLDAMSCGRPIIGCDVPTVRERISNGNGLTYRGGDYKDLAVKIEYLCKNDEIRLQMGDRGRELVEKELSWKIISKKFIECIGE